MGTELFAFEPGQLPHCIANFSAGNSKNVFSLIAKYHGAAADEAKTAIGVD